MRLRISKPNGVPVHSAAIDCLSCWNLGGWNGRCRSDGLDCCAFLSLPVPEAGSHIRSHLRAGPRVYRQSKRLEYPLNAGSVLCDGGAVVSRTDADILDRYNSSIRPGVDGQPAQPVRQFRDGNGFIFLRNRPIIRNEAQSSDPLWSLCEPVSSMPGTPLPPTAASLRHTSPDRLSSSRTTGF